MMTLKVFLLLLATTVAVLQAQGKEDEMKASNQEVVEESESLMARILKKNEHLEEIVLALSKKMDDQSELISKQKAEFEALQKLVEDKEIRLAAVEETVVPGLSTGNDDLDELEKKLTKKIHDTELTHSAHCGYQENVGGSSGLSGSTIIYDRVYEEANTAGSNMDGSSGYFTAGKKGTYLVTLSAYFGYTDDGWFRVDLKTSSGKYQDGWEEYFAYQQSSGTSSLSTPLSAARFVSLDAEETVHLEYTCYGACHIWSLKFCIGIIN